MMTTLTSSSYFLINRLEWCKKIEKGWGVLVHEGGKKEGGVFMGTIKSI